MSRKILWEKWVTPLKPEDSDAEKEFIIFTPIDTLLQKFLTNNKNNMRFWGGNTNFNISPMVSNIIEKTEGVEILSIYARYRFRIGIGRLFDSKQVRENIELALGCAIVRSWPTVIIVPMSCFTPLIIGQMNPTLSNKSRGCVKTLDTKFGNDPI